jgi:16S rRNA (guanine527-N7)-methyltransferase
MTSLASQSLRADLADALTDGLGRLGLEFAGRQIELLIRYLELIVKWNRVHNLTAIREPMKMVSLHLLDSLAIVPLVRAKKILDVGTGAGLPGIPLAIALPESQITLIDTNSKKSAFLTQSVNELQLDNVSVVNARVEQWQGGSFDVIVSRAFSELRDFVEVSRHLLAPDGVFAAMKGAKPTSEIAALPASFAVREIEELRVPGVDAERHLVMIGKA